MDLSSATRRFYGYFSPASFWGMGYFWCGDQIIREIS